MKKNKVFIKVLAVVTAVVVLLFSCSAFDGVFYGGFLPRLPEGTVMEFKEVSEAEFMRSFRPRLMVAHGAEAVNGKNILDDTRYTPSFPSASIPLDGYKLFWDLIEHEVESGVFNPDYARSKKFEPDNIVTEVTKKRVQDMVDNANARHSTGGSARPIKETYCFVAKRKLMYPNSTDYEVDYLYAWYDKNHTDNGTFEGVSIGNFYLQPNTIALMRFNSNGYSTVAYMSADEVSLSQINSGTTAFAWYMGKYKYSVINSDGTVESLDYSSLPNYQSNPATTYFYSANDVNSIVDNSLIDFYDDSPNTYNTIFGDVLTNVQCMFTNGFDGSFGYRGSGYSSDWYISSGAFFPANGTISDYISGNFSIDRNIRAKYAPVYNNFEYTNYINTGSEITTENVTNYNDYGVTYNNDSGEFELDLDVLTAKIEADITPKFDLAFKGVYENQPDIDGDFTVNDKNYIDITDKYITDIVDKFYPPASGWEPPSYPAVNTSVYIPADVPSYETYAVQTVPSSILTQSGSWLHLSYDFFDDLGLIVYIIPLVILGLFWRFTGGD